MNKTVAKKRIWFISPRIGVASEVWMYRQASEMSLFDVQVLTFRHVDKVNYPAVNFDLTLLPEPMLLNRLYRKYLLREKSNFSPLSRRLFQWFSERVNRDQPDAIFCQYGTTAIAMSDLAEKFNIPLIVHFHGFDISKKLREPHYVRTLKNNIKTWRKLVVVAKYQKNWLVENGVQSDSVEIIPCGVPVSEFSLTQSDDGPCVFLAVGRLTPKKSPESTIRAFALCHQKHPDSTLRILGDGKLRSSCEKLAASLGVSDAIEFCGAQPIEDVKKAMSAASVFVQHSVTPASGDMEGWPVALAEAAASSLPVVSTRHASIPDQVIEGKTGFLVDEHDWQAMGNAMIKLAGNPGKRIEFGRSAREHISQWDTKLQIPKLEQAIGSCCL